jgi:hypothetical protein
MRPNSFRWLRVPPALILCGLAAVAIVLVAQSEPGQSILRGIGIEERAESYTAIYFQDPQAVSALTRRASTAHSDVRLAFVVRNRTGARRRLRWEVRNGGVVRAQGARTIPPGHDVPFAPLVSTDCRRVGGPARTPLTISLVGQGESISALVQCRG